MILIFLNKITRCVIVIFSVRETHFILNTRYHLKWKLSSTMRKKNSIDKEDLNLNFVCF